MTIFYISDNHWHHNNVLKFENRPFKTVDKMNESMIETWNSTVDEDDLVHHLGDFSFGGYDKWVSILKQLNGNIILYKGNHDKSRVIKRLYKEGYFEDVLIADYIKSHKYQLYLSHFPMEIGNRPRIYSISGHVHSTPNRFLNQVNIGVDSPLNFGREFGQPISEEELITYLNYINPKVEELFQKERENWS